MIYVLAGVAVIVTVIVIVALMKNKSKSRRVQVCFIQCTPSHEATLYVCLLYSAHYYIYHTPTIPDMNCLYCYIMYNVQYIQCYSTVYIVYIEHITMIIRDI